MSTTSVSGPAAAAVLSATRSPSALMMSISAGAATTGTPLITVSGYQVSVTSHLPLRKAPCPGNLGGSAKPAGAGRILRNSRPAGSSTVVPWYSCVLAPDQRAAAALCWRGYRTSGGDGPLMAEEHPQVRQAVGSTGRSAEPGIARQLSELAREL
jgi:hypothetical protein